MTLPNLTLQDMALAGAGATGSLVAVIHGVLIQRLMVTPMEAQTSAAVIRRLVPALLHYSTVSWLAGGLALIAAALWAGPETRLVTGVGVGALFLYAALGNLWATRGGHPGWMLMAAALALIVFGLWPRP